MDIAEQLGLGVDLSLDPMEATATHSMQAMTHAWENEPTGTFIYRWPVNTQNPTVVESLRDEVGDQITVPDDGRLYYWAYVKPGNAAAIPVLVLEGEVVEFVRLHHALMVAQSHPLLSYVRPVDPRDQETTKRVVEAEFGPGTPLPEPGPHHFLVLVAGQSVLLPSHDVIRFICDLWALNRAQAHGLMAVHGPIDFGKARDVATIRAELHGGEDDTVLDVALPSAGLYHFVALRVPAVVRVPVRKNVNALIPLGEVPAWALAFALGSANPAVNDFIYQKGLMPK